MGRVDRGEGGGTGTPVADEFASVPPALPREQAAIAALAAVSVTLLCTRRTPPPALLRLLVPENLDEILIS